MSRRLHRTVPLAVLAAGLALSGASVALPADASPRTTATPAAPTVVTPRAVQPVAARRAPRFPARHSLRAAATKENFYFVMADRFANGQTSNDTGGIAGGRNENGFDPKDTGFYHGGDLAGLL